MLELTGINKSYGGHVVFDNLNLHIDKGSLYGIIGANGTGKTTLLNIVLNNIEYDGNVIIDSLSNHEFIKNHRNKILYMADTPFVYEFLTGIEFIKFIMDMQRIHFSKVESEINQLLNLFDLQEYKGHLIKDYSLGMKRKISLIPFLVQGPKFLILDEPVSGMDTKSIIILKRILKTLALKGVTVIFTTHMLDLIENLCDTVAILHDKTALIVKNIHDLRKNELEEIYLKTSGINIENILSNVL